LASIVFKDSSKLENLNSILHPRVEEHFLKWLVEHKESPYIIHEAAILFESGFDKFFDKIITVTAPLELCILRVMERDGVSAFQVEQRMKKQWGQELKASKSDFVLVNNGKRLLLPQILNIHRMFLAE
jgi:dephospho-CoA kinase